MIAILEFDLSSAIWVGLSNLCMSNIAHNTHIDVLHAVALKIVKINNQQDSIVHFVFTIA